MFILFKFAWLSNLHYGKILDSGQRILKGSNGFYFRFSNSCDLNCTSPQPSVANGALNNVKQCGFLPNISERARGRRMLKSLQKVVSHPERFKVTYDVVGSMKSFRFMEELKQKDSTFFVLVLDTATCKLVRIDNFCDFIESSELLKQIRD